MTASLTQPTRNPFYVILLAACAAMLVTMFIYLAGWIFVPNPDKPMMVDHRPPWMRWVDRHAIFLIAGEIAAVILLAILTITLDKYFDPGPPTSTSDPTVARSPSLGPSRPAEIVAGGIDRSHHGSPMGDQAPKPTAEPSWGHDNATLREPNLS